MLPSRTIPIGSGDPSHAGNARRQALSLAEQMNFDELRTGQLGIVVTEAARNIQTHAGSGEIVLSPWTHDGRGGIDMLALDKGHGIKNLAAALEDGYSTAGTPGNGLGAMSRLSGLFQVYTLAGSVAGAGTAVFARILRTAQETESESAPYTVGAISVPIQGEMVCGDAWSMQQTADRSVYIVADGLGHGPMAAEAAVEAVRVFEETSHNSPEQILNEIHYALVKTRGAAVSVAEILPGRGILNYAGVGNIAASTYFGGKTRSLVSMNGTVGHTVSKIQQFASPWVMGMTLIMHSDGLATRWNVEQYPGLAARHPALVAGVLLRDFSRKRDDATVVVSRV